MQRLEFVEVVPVLDETSWKFEVPEVCDPEGASRSKVCKLEKSQVLDEPIKVPDDGASYKSEEAVGAVNYEGDDEGSQDVPGRPPDSNLMLSMVDFVISSYKQQSRRDIWCFNMYVGFPDDKDAKDFGVCPHFPVVPDLEDPVCDSSGKSLVVRSLLMEFLTLMKESTSKM